jgi:hypothetical protein
VFFSTPGKLAFANSALLSEFGGIGFIPGMECARNETPKTLTTYFQEELVDLELSVE